jgi:protocatechuate 3,4-dioxygenase beta subunit
VLAPESEPGERLILSGAVYAADGGTPAPAITVYAYHTDSRGLYGWEEAPAAAPRLRAWARTNSAGRYEFHTIKPAPYPNRGIAAHIHMTISSPEIPEWWIPTLYFAGDPLVAEKAIAESEAEGRFGSVLPIVRDERGVWRCARDIRL